MPLAGHPLASVPTLLDLSSLEDEVLMEEAQQGDQDAFAELVRRHSQRVYRVALNILKDHGESEDVVQQTFINVFRALD